MKQKSLGIGLIIYSLIAWIASATLVLERLELYKDSDHKAGCDFGLFVSCTGVMKSAEASLFGFPNPFLGIVGFAITGTIGVFLLMTSKILTQPLPKWFMAALQLGSTLSLLLVCFFWYTSVINLMTLCPWCMIVWAMVIPLFFHTTVYNASTGLFGASAAKVGRKLTPWIWTAVIIVYAIIFASVLVRFQEYIF